MSNVRTISLVAIAGILLLGVIWRYSSAGADPSAATRVLAQEDDLVRAQQRVLALTRAGRDSLPELRQMLADATEPAIRAVCLQGLGDLYDYESLEAIIDGLEDPDVEVRTRAKAQVERMIGYRIGYDPDAPAAKRKELADFYRQEWARIKGSPLIKNFEARMVERLENK